MSPLSYSVSKKAPGMSEVATYLPSIESIIHDIMRPSVDTVDSDVSSLDNQFLCFITSENPITLIVTGSFLIIRKTRYTRLFLRCL